MSDKSRLHCDSPPCPTVNALFEAVKETFKGMHLHQTFTNALLLMILGTMIGFGFKAVGAANVADKNAQTAVVTFDLPPMKLVDTIKENKEFKLP